MRQPYLLRGFYLIFTSLFLCLFDAIFSANLNLTNQDSCNKLTLTITYYLSPFFIRFTLIVLYACPNFFSYTSFFINFVLVLLFRCPVRYVVVGGNRIQLCSDWPSQISKTSGVTAAPFHNNTDNKRQDTSVRNKKVISISHFQDDESN